jgi:hypothetical protein
VLGLGWGKGREMTQALYAHMNKKIIIKLKRKVANQKKKV